MLLHFVLVRFIKYIEAEKIAKLDWTEVMLAEDSSGKNYRCHHLSVRD